MFRWATRLINAIAWMLSKKRRIERSINSVKRHEMTMTERSIKPAHRYLTLLNSEGRTNEYLTQLVRKDVQSREARLAVLVDRRLSLEKLHGGYGHATRNE